MTLYSLLYDVLYTESTTNRTEWNLDLSDCREIDLSSCSVVYGRLYATCEAFYEYYCGIITQI